MEPTSTPHYLHRPHRSPRRLLWGIFAALWLGFLGGASFLSTATNAYAESTRDIRSRTSGLIWTKKYGVDIDLLLKGSYVGAQSYLKRGKYAIGFKYASNDLTQDIEGDSEDTLDGTVTLSNAGIAGHWYPGNSFRFGLELSQNRIDVTSNLTIEDVRYLDGELRAELIAISVGLANEWLFNLWSSVSFMFGIEWARVHFPITEQVSVRVPGLPAEQEQESALLVQQANRLISLAPGGLSLILGVSF